MTPLNRALAVALVAGLTGASTALGGSWWLGALGAQPARIAVVNLGGLIQAAAGGREIVEADVSKGFAQMRAIGEALSAQGYLVLDASAVIDAPEAFYVPRRGAAPPQSEVSTGGVRP